MHCFARSKMAKNGPFFCVKKPKKHVFFDFFAPFWRLKNTKSCKFLSPLKKQLTHFLKNRKSPDSKTHFFVNFFLNVKFSFKIFHFFQKTCFSKTPFFQKKAKMPFFQRKSGPLFWPFFKNFRCPKNFLIFFTPVFSKVPHMLKKQRLFSKFLSKFSQIHF